MNVTETIALLDVIAAFDKRKVGEADIEAWDEALEDLAYEDCREAVSQHFKHSEDWLKPARVRSLVRGIVNDRVMRAMAAPNGCVLGPRCCTGPLIPKPADYDELVALAREQARPHWFDENGRHKAYLGAKEAQR